MFNIINNSIIFDPACILVPSELEPQPLQWTDVSQNTPKPTGLDPYITYIVVLGLTVDAEVRRVVEM